MYLKGNFKLGVMLYSPVMNFLKVKSFLPEIGLVPLNHFCAPKCNFFNKQDKTILLTDASRLDGIGFLLIQQPKSSSLTITSNTSSLLFSHSDSKLIQCGSFSLIETQYRYATIELELLALVRAVEKFKIFSTGNKFVLCYCRTSTSHTPLSKSDHKILYITSSSYNPQSNSESSVNRIKMLLKKSKSKNGFNEYIMYLRSMVTTTNKTSPAKVLLGRELRTLLPTLETASEETILNLRIGRYHGLNSGQETRTDTGNGLLICSPTPNHRSLLNFKNYTGATCLSLHSQEASILDEKVVALTKARSEPNSLRTIFDF
ncbi:unnamed protein product [Lepeophtheirus salmonis]|uniref:(salmon louse) hypothetical protein n=1 Tax=Lepeophtheirus salmonis TaxID=72036 RepID=A0A7R8CT45_LEPSM|nr:unnamed protein product [Lepeophtheirus salmonis]CAF2920753.1 unnamed protein product [Lepeophtheirus salmonis]